MKVVLTDLELDRLRAVLARAAGLVFEDSRRDSLGYGVAERMRATGDPDVAAYLSRVEAPGSAELQPLVDEVTIQETHFFRNPPQIRALREHVLPELVARADTRGRRIRIWSAGCSTGEEPYTVAMALRELLPITAGWDVKVIGTDISAGALQAARTATYGRRALQLATPRQLARFFTPTDDGRHQVRPEVRELVEFRHHNLAQEAPPDDGLDLVLCRNVTIYFSRDTTRALVRRLHGALRDGGYLFLGHSETLWQISEDFRLVTLGTGDRAAFVYRRLDPGGEQRAVLPDRRTEQQAPATEQRVAARRAQAPRPGGVVRVPAPSSHRAPDRGDPRAEDLSGTATAGPSGPAEPTGTTTAVPRGPAEPPGTATAVPRGPAQPPGTATAVPRGPADGKGLVRVRHAIAQGRYADAARLARLTADVDPLVAEAHYLLGRALVEAGDDRQALPALRRAVYLAPEGGLAHFLLAGALARSGDPAAAAREYRAAALTLNGDSAAVDAPELGGRSVRELAALCAQLEGQLMTGTR